MSDPWKVSIEHIKELPIIGDFESKCAFNNSFWNLRGILYKLKCQNSSGYLKKKEKFIFSFIT